MKKEELEIKKLKSETTKNTVSWIAIMMGGLWALFSFNALKSSSIAEADLLKKRTEIEVMESGFGAMEFSIDTEQLQINSNQLIPIALTVSIKNKSSNRIDVDLTGKELMTVSKIEKVNSNTSVSVSKIFTARPYSLITPTVLRHITSTSVPPNTTARVNFLIEVEKPGTYFASFISEIPKDVLVPITEYEIGDKDEAVTHGSAWMAQKYFSVLNTKSNKSMQPTANASAD